MGFGCSDSEYTSWGAIPGFGSGISKYVKFSCPSLLKVFPGMPTYSNTYANVENRFPMFSSQEIDFGIIWNDF